MYCWLYSVLFLVLCTFKKSTGCTLKSTRCTLKSTRCTIKKSEEDTINFPKRIINCSFACGNGHTHLRIMFPVLPLPLTTLANQIYRCEHHCLVAIASTPQDICTNHSNCLAIDNATTSAAAPTSAPSSQSLCDRIRFLDK